MRQTLISITQKLRLPSICRLCQQLYKGPHAVCSSCIQFIPPLGNRCQTCAMPLPLSDFLICGHCIANPPHVDQVHVAYPYEEPLRGLLHDFKYQNGLYLRSFLCHLMLKALPSTKAQCLIPIPMHPHRLKQRGFNHAAILAKTLAHHLTIPCDFKICKKIINTVPQATLNSQERKKNLRHAFSVKPSHYQQVILVDDLLTTGATANELAITLKKQGVTKVDLWCCARTLPYE